jgi:hypothetical protein
MDALLGNVAPAPRSKLTLTGNLGTALGRQLDTLRDTGFGYTAAVGAVPLVAARAPSVAFVNALAAEINAVLAGLPTTNDAELSTAIKVAGNYAKAITSGDVESINGKRAAALEAAAAAAGAAGAAVAIRAAAAGLVAAAPPAGAGAGAGVALYNAIATTRGLEAPGAVALAQLNTDFSNIKWLAKAIAYNTIATAAATTAAGGVDAPKINIRIIAHAIAFGNNKGLLPNAAINLQNLLNSANGTDAAASVLGNPSVTDLHNTIVARLSEENVQSLTNIFNESLLVVLRNEFTGKLSVYDPYDLPGPIVNENSLDFDKFLPADVLQAVLANRQKKFFPMARVNISPSYFGLFAPGNQLRFELQRGGASLDPNMPIEMRGRGSAVYGSAIKGGDYNNWQVVGNNAFISDKLDFALQTAIKRLGTKLSETARGEIQTMIATLKAAEKEAKEAAENLKTIVKAHQATPNGLTNPIDNNAALKVAATEYNNRIGKVAKVEGKLGRVYATLVIS